MTDSTMNATLIKYAEKAGINIEVLEDELQAHYLDLIRSANDDNDIDSQIKKTNDAEKFLELTRITPSDETTLEILKFYMDKYLSKTKTGNGGNEWSTLKAYAKKMGFEDIPNNVIIYGCNQCIIDNNLYILNDIKMSMGISTGKIPEESILFGFEHYTTLGDYNSIFELQKYTKLEPGDETYSAICKKIGLEK